MVGIESTEQGDQTEDGEDAGRPGWRRRTAVGGMATGLALGLQDIFHPSHREPVITAEAPGDPPDAKRRLRVVLDPDDPAKSVALLPEAPPPDDDLGTELTPGGPPDPPG